MNDCTHVTFTKVFDIGGHPIIAGSFSDLEDYVVTCGPPWLILSLSVGNVSPTAVSLISMQDFPKDQETALAQLVARTQFKVPTIKITWPDGGIPTFSKAFWENLVEFITNAPGTGPVFVHCQGGHGRTGTALAILMALSGNIKVKHCPIRKLRNIYCESAVETESQIWYVGQMVPNQIKCKPSHQVTPVQHWSPNTPLNADTPGWKEYHPNKDDDNKHGYTEKNKYGDVKVDSKDIPSDWELEKQIFFSHQIGYTDFNGALIGKTFEEAIKVLRDRYMKEVKS